MQILSLRNPMCFQCASNARQASSAAVSGLHKHLLAEVLNFLVLGLIQRCENNGEEYLASLPLCAYRPAGQRSRILLESAAMISSYKVIQTMYPISVRSRTNFSKRLPRKCFETAYVHHKEVDAEHEEKDQDGAEERSFVVHWCQVDISEERP